MKVKILSAMVAMVLLSGCEMTAESIADTAKNTYRQAAHTVSKAIGSNGDVSPNAVREKFDINPVFAAYDPLLGAYATSMISILIAQEIWLKALGKAELAAELEAQRKELETGKDLSDDSFKKIAKLSEQTQALIEETQAEEKQLSNENGLLFATGFVPYAVGVKQAREIGRIYPDYVDALKTDITDVNKVAMNMVKSQSLYYVGASSPGLLNTLYKTTILVFKYADDQGLEIPSEGQQVRDIAEMEL
ncbi:MAG: hypothetical protein ACJAW1_002883 [Glaciecola sp.]|jgi:hypothetical protein